MEIVSHVEYTFVMEIIYAIAIYERDREKI